MVKVRRKPRKIKKKKTIWRSRFFRLAILCVILLMEIFYLLIFSSLFQIKEIIVVTPEALPKHTFQKIIQEKTAKKLFFFPTKSIFLIRPRHIKQVILEKYSQIGKVWLKRKLPSLLIVEIRNRQASANWCQDLSLAQEKCFFIDDQGIIFEEVFTMQQPPDLVIISQEEIAREPGQRAIEEETMTLILDIKRELAKDRQIEIEKFVMAPDRLVAKVGEWPGRSEQRGGSEIYFDLEGDIKEQIFNLGMLLEKETVLKDSQIQYIDLRFGNKVYYRQD